MADALTAEIGKTESERDELSVRVVDMQRQCDLLEAKLSALKLAATLRPLKHEPVRARLESGASRGRQPGAITRRWRRILVEATEASPHGAGSDEIAAIALHHGISIRERDVNFRCKKYEEQGIVESAHRGWRLQAIYLARFKAENVDGDDHENGDEADTDDYEEAAA